MENETMLRAIGNITLYTLIGFSAVMLIIMAFRKAWYWFATFAVIAGTIIAAEITSFLVKDKSISTQYGEWIAADPFWAWTALGCFLLAMASLVAHLAAYGFRKKGKK